MNNYNKEEGRLTTMQAIKQLVYKIVSACLTFYMLYRFLIFTKDVSLFNFAFFAIVLIIVSSIKDSYYEEKEKW